MKSDTTGLGQHLRARPKLRLVFVVAMVVVAVGLLWLVRRVEMGHGSAAHSEPTVAVAKVDREDLYREVTIPAEFRPV